MKTDCNCIEEIDKVLANHQTKLDLCLFMDGGVVPVVTTVKLNAKQRQKPRQLLPSYCPFCGKAYITSQPEALEEKK